MSTKNLQISESLKERLEFLLNEFESYRVSNMELAIATPELTGALKTEIRENKSSFFKKFFFSDF